MDDDRLRRALGALADDAPDGADTWTRTQQRITQRGRRRHVAIGAAATALVAIVGIGTAFAVTGDDDGDPVVAGPGPTESTAASTSTTSTTTTSTTVPPELLAVPDLVGIDVGEARNAAVAAGFGLDAGTALDGDRVTAQDIAPGTSVARGTTIVVHTCGSDPPCVALGTLPPPDDFAGASEYRTVPVASLDDIYTAPAAGPQQKVDDLVAALKAQPIEGNRDAFGVVNTVEGNRARIEVRVIGMEDDAIGGIDVRLHLLQQSPGGPWIVVDAETRELCSRAFDGTLCV